MTSDARMRASRQNGARSRGPRTAAGKARSARNALKHGLRARKLVLLEGEDAAEFRWFARALEAELVPAGRLQADLVGRIAIAAWRARRADQLEAGVLGGYLEAAGAVDPDPRAALATGLTRDNYGPRALATLVRYRGSVLAELFRSLAALKLLQAGAPPATPGPRRPLTGPSRSGRNRPEPAAAPAPAQALRPCCRKVPDAVPGNRTNPKNRCARTY
ncbi:MAG TPA: hypothetical protein VHQ91_15680 [Geminicoccaceae bacterium]|nr:hypothetical protein [Geminicoccaceae bacterium]